MTQPGFPPLGSYPAPPVYPTQAGYPQLGYATQPGYPMPGGAVVVGPALEAVPYPSQPFVRSSASNVNKFYVQPVGHKCQYCQTEMVTSTHFTAGGMTWVAAGVICLFG